MQAKTSLKSLEHTGTGFCLTKNKSTVLIIGLQRPSQALRDYKKTSRFRIINSYKEEKKGVADVIHVRTTAKISLFQYFLF